MSSDKKFACAINCMDGRVQDAVKNYMKDNYGVDYVDMVTEPGPNKILADNLDSAVIENIKKRVEISVGHHGSKIIAVVGHFGCAGNPTEKEEQIQHLKKAEVTVKGFGFDAEIVLLWVDGDWTTVEKV
jgi:carbonic anhydrase